MCCALGAACRGIRSASLLLAQRAAVGKVSQKGGDVVLGLGALSTRGVGIGWGIVVSHTGTPRRAPAAFGFRGVLSHLSSDTQPGVLE